MQNFDHDYKWKKMDGWMVGSHCNTQTIFTTEVDQILLVAKTKQNRREL